RPRLRAGYWHLKEGTEEQTTPKFTPDRLYTAYNNGVTPPAGYEFSHTYVLTELDPVTASYYARGWGDNNTWEVHYPDDRFKSYCINLHRGSPSGYYDRTLVSGNSIITEGFLDSDNYGYAPLGDNMEEALITLIYYGYGNDADGIQTRYGLSDAEFLLLTQQAIWDYTDRYNNISERNRETNSGKAYYELVSKRFSEIPNNQNLKLYLYESIDGNQNLLSISGLSDEAHAGVRILKLTNASDGSLEPLVGAEFTIYDSDNQEVAIIRSDENGYATKYNTDSIYGLPEGVYKIQETKAPRGYTPNSSSQYYTFIVRPSDDNEIITIGKLNGTGDDTPMIFENTNNTTVEGGGLIIKIINEQDEPILTGAEFEILYEDGNVINAIWTGGDAQYMTGYKDLPLHKTYTARLKTPPVGYITTIEIQSETLTENEQYKTLIFRFIKKTCNVSIEATKKYNGDLSKDKFEFELHNLNNGTSLRTTNNADGKVRFDLSLDASDIGNVIYELKEIQGASNEVIYDTNSFEIAVSVSDQGDGHLVCEVMQGTMPEFINQIKVDSPETGS
ncbi:thioester-forming surface-anchored protein, partial [Candidatus Saccharibacteria bacterium]|nr:thioester-forming surface-anchored protein [Candidatus Saccharibacteria bacterium]